MKVLFVVHDLGFADPLAISYLSAIAKEAGHQTFFTSLDINDLVDVVKKIQPDVIGYSVNVLGYEKTIKANKKVKEVHDFVSIMGGPHATFSPETFEESGFDAYCIGEGEYAFRDFLEKVNRKEPFDDIPNLITKKKANQVRPFITNLDELPPADRDLVFSNSHLGGTSRKVFAVSRGCPFNCAYCYNSYYRKLYHGKGAAVRRFSVERVIREIEDVKQKYRMDFIKFSDDCFAFKADEWLEEFAEKYSKRIGIPFNCYLRVDTISDEILNLLKKAGCFSVMLSIDSTSKEIRENVLERNMRSDDLIERLVKLHNYGINTVVNYMLAIPGSTLEDDLYTIEFSKKAKVTYPSYTITVPMKGTRLYDYTIENYNVSPESFRSDMSDITIRSTLPCFTEKEKDIRYNILLLGAIIIKLPFPLDKIVMFLIKIIPPNRLFRKINEMVVEHNYKHNIFKLSEDNIKAPRIYGQSGAN